MKLKKGEKLYVHGIDFRARRLIASWFKKKRAPMKTIDFATKQGELIIAYLANEKLKNFLLSNQKKNPDSLFFKFFVKKPVQNIPTEIKFA